MEVIGETFAAGASCGHPPALDTQNVGRSGKAVKSEEAIFSDSIRKIGTRVQLLHVEAEDCGPDRISAENKASGKA
jgi:hypothetical protein